ncbi:MAG TPA: 2-C-methyl-D-erythritol 4-phosphate cytidylyltransferase [Candidatus Limnocylindrales bacterium]|nr:2-C-methyl-D-erythritol 4-phosphate cytidylyltransferase [Candidatus Limnocylindrales bacterium]
MIGTGVIADAVVVAAGRSERMGGRDKLAAELGGKPLLAWSVAALAASPVVERIVLVRAPDQAGGARPEWLPDKVVAVVPGGARRQDSVAAGIRALDGSVGDGRARVVLVHDGARPLVTPHLVAAVANAAAEHGAAIPVLPVAETLKQVDGDRIVGNVDRTGIATAQTPQGIRWDVLRSAISHLDDPDREFTDEAALLEAAGVAVHTVPGEGTNLKVTRPDDLAIAEARLVGATAIRTGFGADGHSFGPGDGLRLGGIEIPGAPRLFGHSDGDAALHAIAGALLGAAALGDLGGLHPADERTPRGVASTDLLRGVRRALDDAGWAPRSVDLTIRGARPWIQASMPAMRQAIADILGLDIGAVSVKASTGNLSGDAGAGRSIEAQAVATVAQLRIDR